MQSRGIEVPLSTIVGDYRKISDLILSKALTLGLSRKRNPSIDVLIDNHSVAGDAIFNEANRSTKSVFVTVSFRPPDKKPNNIRLWLDANPASRTYKVCFQSSADGTTWNRVISYGELTNVSNVYPDEFIGAGTLSSTTPDPQVLSMTPEGVLTLSGGGGSVDVREILLPTKLTNLDGSIKFSVGE